jgi:hypothetical protein
MLEFDVRVIRNVRVRNCANSANITILAIYLCSLEFALPQLELLELSLKIVFEIFIFP